MAVFETLLAVSVIFWGALALYLFWIDRKLVSLKKTLETLKDERKKTKTST